MLSGVTGMSSFGTHHGLLSSHRQLGHNLEICENLPKFRIADHTTQEGSPGPFVHKNVRASSFVMRLSVGSPVTQCRNEAKALGGELTHLDILPEQRYIRLECLLKSKTSASNCFKALWTC